MINILLSTARSGSTWYGTVLSRKYKATFLNEIFHDELKEHHRKALVDVMKMFLGSDNHCVIKIFPSHFFKTNITDLESVLFDAASNVEILIRRNFNSQLKSMYVAYEYENLLNPDRLTTIPHTWQDNFNESLIIKNIDQLRLETITRRLQRELIFLSGLYQKYNFKLTYFEDIKDNHADLNLQVGKLHRPVIWEEPFPHISFDTEGLFQ